MTLSGLLASLNDAQALNALVAHNWPLGCALIALMVFLETGLVVMPFLPGDSMLFAAGAVLGLAGLSPLWPLLLIGAAAIAGDALNYAIGRSRFGQLLIRRGWVKPAHLAKTRRYFERFGGPTVVIGRFLPIVRTLAPFLSGLTAMPWRRFALYNALGALLWAGGLISAGYWLGRIGWIRQHLDWLSVGLMPTTSLLWLAVPAWLRWRRRRAERAVAA